MNFQQVTLPIKKASQFMQTSGGIDWQVQPSIAVRIVQFDWIRTNLSRDNGNFSPQQGSLPVLKGWQANYRFSAGITFRFGEKGVPK